MTLSINDTQLNNSLSIWRVSRFIYWYAECHYAEFLYAECHYAECHFAECHYAECRYAKCHYAECQDAQLIAIIFASNISQKLGIKGSDHNTLFSS